MGFSSRWSGAVLISSVSFLLTVAVAQADLINRSFETGPDPGEVMALPPGSTAIDGWTVVGSNISYVGGRWKPADGLRSVGLLCGGGISQTFQTEPDQKYEVRFNMAGDPNTLPAVKTLAVSFGTEDRAFTFDTTGRSPGDMGWEARFWIFTATDDDHDHHISQSQGRVLDPGRGQRAYHGGRDRSAGPSDDVTRDEPVATHPASAQHWLRSRKHCRASCGLEVDAGEDSASPPALLQEQVSPVRSPRTQPASICHSGSSRDCQRRTPLCV